MKHIFDVEVAKLYGIQTAVVLENIIYWIEKNKANDIHFHDNDYWTYNSLKAWQELFPYLTKRQIEYALNKLVEEDIIKKGNFNTSALDRTTWYALTEKGRCISQNCFTDFTKLGNAFHTSVTAIPNINNTNINTDINNNKEKYKKESIVKSTIEYLNLKANTNYKSTTTKTIALINARVKEGFTLEDFKKVIDNKCKTWLKTDYEKYLRPETLFGTKFEGYLNENVNSDNSSKSKWDYDRELKDTRGLL